MGTTIAPEEYFQKMGAEFPPKRRLDYMVSTPEDHFTNFQIHLLTDMNTSANNKRSFLR